jgi:hypothetical protein
MVTIKTNMKESPMKKVNTNFYKRLMFVAMIPAVMGLWNQTFAKCATCPMQDTTESQQDKKDSEKICDNLKTDMANIALDNPKDSTTGRYTLLIGYIFDKRFIHSNTTIKCFQTMFINLLKNDPYPQIRKTSAIWLGRSMYTGQEVYNALNEALFDPSLTVRVEAAVSLAERHSDDQTLLELNPEAKKILTDAALGVNRSEWNTKGFYTQEEYTQDSNRTTEKLRDIIQLTAISGLKQIIGEDNTKKLIDNYSKGADTEEKRNNAKKGKKFWEHHTGDQ